MRNAVSKWNTPENPKMQKTPYSSYVAGPHPVISLARVRLSACIALLMFLSCLAVNVAAQPSSSSGVQGGRGAGSYNLDNFDNVNIFQGNINFSLPLVSAGGRGEAGVTVPLTIENNWKLITGYIGQAPAYSYIPDSMNGAMQEGPGKVTVQVTGSDFTEVTCGGIADWEPQNAKLKINFKGADGTSYSFRSTSNSGAPYQVQLCPTGAQKYNHGTEFISWDGSGAKFVSDVDIKSMITYDAVDPSGYILLPNGVTYRVDGGYVSWIQDRNGNRTAFTYSSTTGLLQTITDSNGRVTTFAYDQNQSPYGYHTKITYKGFGGTERAIRISYKGLSDALRSGTTDFPNHPVVSDLWLPDGRKFTFLYSIYGNIAKVTIPTGAVYEYDYDVIAAPLAAQFINNGAPYIRLSERRLYSDGVNLSQKTTYTSASPFTVDTYDGSGTRLSRVKHYFAGSAGPVLYTGANMLEDEEVFNNGRETKTEYFAGNGTSLLRTVDTVWAVGRSATWNIYGSNTIIDHDARIQSVTTTLPDTGYTNGSVYVYDSNAGYNLQTDVYDYDYGSGGTPGNFLRRSHTDYEQSTTYTGNAAHLLNLPTQKWVSSDSSGNTIVSRIRFEYDNYTPDTNHAALVSRSNITGHNSSGFGTGYAPRGNLTKMTTYADADGETGGISTYRQYDIAGNPVKGIDAKGNADTLDYSDCFGTPDADARTNSTPSQISGLQTFAFARSATKATGYTTYTQVDYYIGVAVDSEDILGNVSSNYYNDSLDRLVQTITFSNRSAYKKQTTIAYDDANGKITATSDSKAYNDNLLKVESLHDKMGRNIESRQYEDASNYIASKQEYDSLDRAYKVSNPYRPYLSETAQWTTTTFDGLGRITEIKTPDNAVVTRTYTGNTVRVYDQDSKSRAGVTDGIGRLTKVIEYDQSTQWETNYTHDVLGRLRKTSQIDPNSVQQNRYFMYNDLGRLIRAKQAEQTANSSLNITDPVTGNSGWSVSYGYDNNGNTTSTTDSRNKTITATYDNLNRLTYRDYSDSTPDVTFTYDDGNIANSKGSLTAVTSDVSANYSLTFDELGRVTSSRQTTGSTNYNFDQYVYDFSGALVSEKYPSGRVVETESDNIGRLTKVTSKLPSQVEKIMLGNISYTSFGSVKSARLGNGRWESAVFDNKRLQTKQISLGGSASDSSLMKIEYDFGTTTNNGSLRQQKITVPGAAYPIIQDYSYDQLNRLQSATEKVNTVVQWKQTFLYDRFGNRRFDAANTTTLPANNGTYNPQVDPQTNKFVTTDGYTYDSEGNMTANPENQLFTYDAESKQTKVQNTATEVTADYYYDGQGRRVKKVIGSEETVFVYDAFGKLVAEYATFIDSRPKTTNYLTTDTLGSPRMVTNALGQVVSRHDYLPFGEEVLAGTGGRTTGQGYNGDDGVRKQFTGYERDTESGLDYAQNRYYSGKHGRFTTVDPMAASANTRNPQTLNRYSYGMNSPHKFTDPIGLAPQHCWGGFCNTYAADEAADAVELYYGRASTAFGVFTANAEAEWASRVANTMDAANVNAAVNRGDQGSAERICASNPGIECVRGASAPDDNVPVVVIDQLDLVDTDDETSLDVLAKGDPNGLERLTVDATAAKSRIKEGAKVYLRVAFMATEGGDRGVFTTKDDATGSKSFSLSVTSDSKWKISEAKVVAEGATAILYIPLKLQDGTAERITIKATVHWTDKVVTGGNGIPPTNIEKSRTYTFNPRVKIKFN